jgi:predicted dehydrogenase
VKIAILGLGSAGQRYAEDVSALGHGVIGFDPRLPAGAESAEAAVQAADAVIVASPSVLHAEHACLAIRHGKPVLVEKPLATTVAAAQQVVDAGAASDLTCGVAMNLRFHPGVLGLHKLVADATLGEVRLAKAWFGFDLRRWRPDVDYRQTYSARRSLGGGIVSDAIHELDYLIWLLGPVRTVAAETGRLSELEIDVEDTAVALLSHSSGALAMVDLNFWESAYRRGCLLSGDRATATWDWGSGRIEIVTPENRSALDVAADVRDTYRAELDDFVAAIGEGRQPRIPLWEGLAAVRVAEAIKESAREGHRVGLL